LSGKNIGGRRFKQRPRRGAEKRREGKLKEGKILGKGAMDCVCIMLCMSSCSHLPLSVCFVSSC
jgi:hypothetical protein